MSYINFALGSFTRSRLVVVNGDVRDMFHQRLNTLCKAVVLPIAVDCCFAVVVVA